MPRGHDLLQTLGRRIRMLSLQIGSLLQRRLSLLPKWHDLWRCPWPLLEAIFRCVFLLDLIFCCRCHWAISSWGRFESHWKAEQGTAIKCKFVFKVVYFPFHDFLLLLLNVLPCFLSICELWLVFFPSRCKDLSLSNLLLSSSVSSIGSKTKLCPNPEDQCLDGQTCCQISKTDYGCCPFTNAVCCTDMLHCCPHNTLCDLKFNACRPPGPSNGSSDATSFYKSTWESLEPIN